MNLRTHLSRSNGYRELGMFDESILELEATTKLCIYVSSTPQNLSLDKINIKLPSKDTETLIY